MENEGSYKIKNFAESETELKRLQDQANIMKALEKKFLLDCGIKPHHRVLEVGCGPGFITNILCELAPEGEIIATDTDEDLLKICRKNITNPPKGGVKIINANEEDLSAYKNSIDFVYLRFVLQHVPDKEKLLASVYESLAPGGVVCVLDSDDGLILHYPEDAFQVKLLKAAQTNQAAKGGDRHIGRKLSYILKKMKFKDVRNKIISFTTSDIPFLALAQILFGHKSQIAGKSEETKTWIEETSVKVEKGEYFLSAGIFLTTGKK